MSYRLVRKLQQEAVPVTQACRLLQISRAGYYQHWQRRTQAADIVTTAHLKAAFTASGSTYGSRRLVNALGSRARNWPLSSTTPDAGSCIAPGVETQVYPHHR